MHAGLVVLSSDTDGSNAAATTPLPGAFQKRRPVEDPDGTPQTGGPNQRKRKDRQPNWSPPEIMALINAKEAEHDVLKLCGDSQDLMQTTTQKWEKVVSDVSKAGFSVHHRGAAACKDKWQILLADFKKISDYNAATGSWEDYFHMPTKRHKELTLPANFCATHFREMEKFMSQRPCLNPPRQQDSFALEENNIHSTKDLARYCSVHHVTEEMLIGGDVASDPDIMGDMASPGMGGSQGLRLQHTAGPSALHSSKRKEKLDNAARNMATDPRPMNTRVRRCHSSIHTKLVEVTETHGKQIVSNMDKMSSMEEKKVLAIGEIAEKQLQYFKIRDAKINITQRGLVQAVNGLSAANVQAYASRGRYG